MIDLSDITKAIKSQISGHADIVDTGFRVERTEYVNVDPRYAHAGWCGVYPGRITYEPTTLGNHSLNYSATVVVRVVVQASVTTSGAECEEVLEGYMKNVMTALLSDKTFGNTVDIVKTITDEPQFLETENESLYFQQRLLTITSEVRTG